MQYDRTSEKECPSLNAKDGIVMDEQEISTKVSYGMINILTIKIGLTFRLEKNKFTFDESNPTSGYGIMSVLYPFIQNFASIDGTIKLNELIIQEGFLPMNMLQSLIIAKYRS
jgi:hypothetical protein